MGSVAIKYKLHLFLNTQFVYTCMYVCMYVCMCEYACIYGRIHSGDVHIWIDPWNVRIYQLGENLLK